MGLSCYLSNSSTTTDYMLQQSLEIPQELLLELGCFQHDFTLADTSIDTLFHLPTQKQPNFVSQPPQLQTTRYENSSSQLLPYVQEKSCHPKRQKIAPYPDQQQNDTPFNYDSMLAPSIAPFFDGSSSAADDARLLQWVPEFEADDQSWLHDGAPCFPADAFACGTAADRPANNNISSRLGRGVLSAQSIAARQRRRKLADKTQELGKLIPGGHRMNTAEMFQSASMYVKYLQAQIAMLTLTNSLQGAGSSQCVDEGRQHIQVLATSPALQEKLYTQEKCLVPRKLVQSLSADSKLQSQHPSFIKQINNLLATPQAE